MSLKPSPIQPVPEETARVARAVFRKGNPLLSLRDELGAIFADTDFADLFPRLGQPGLSPWRLALITLLQFRENLPDRHAAEAVRARIDWKYLLGLELTDPGFDHSVPCEFRARLLAGSAEERLLHKLLEACQARGLLKARGRQRTDATRVLAAVRLMNRLELLGETLRAALNELATIAPDWLRGAAPAAWYQRYARRIEDSRLPQSAAEREIYVRTVGEDGFALLDLLERSEAAKELRQLPKVELLRQIWARHFIREPTEPSGGGGAVRLRGKDDPPPSAPAIETPYDPQARYRTRSGAAWTGYIVHLSESCEDDAVHLLTHVMTTTAAVHEARCTAAISTRPWPARACRRASTSWMRPTSTPSSWCAAVRSWRLTWSARRGRTRPGRARSRVVTRSIGLRSTGSGSRRAARGGRCPRPGAGRPTMPACPTSR